MHPSFAVFAALLATVGGQAIPLSTLEQAEFLTQHNTIRARPGSQNMECITEWSTSLATAAAAQAARCNLTAPTNDANGYFYHSSSDRLTPAEILEQIWTTHTIAYDYLQNSCNNNLATDNECANVRQMLWYEGGEIGCAKHQCATPSAIITVCAYPARAVPHSRPYALVPNFQPCTLCRSSFPVCRSQLCCKSTASLTPSPQPPQPGNTPAGLVNLERLYNNALTKNILETSQASINQQVAAGANRLGPIGKIPTAPDANCQELKPVRTFTKSAAPTTNFYATEEIDRRWAQNNGYSEGGIIGYAVSASGACGASVPVYTFYNDHNGFVQLTDQSDVDDLLANRKWLYYRLRGISFYIWDISTTTTATSPQPPQPAQPSQPGIIPAGLVNLERLYNNALTKNILETSQASINQQIAAGASRLGPIGKIPTAPDANCQELKPVRTFTKSAAPTTNFYATEEIDRRKVTTLSKSILATSMTTEQIAVKAPDILVKVQ
uniref:SCP domain-containing protein n=1 Tax=Trichuris muris TaxID=70415 RepID=A0A5S6QGH1_TRIMR